ncbi:MAG: hypothetical protein RIM84_07815 [Alphaproteobacteria bacterium]
MSEITRRTVLAATAALPATATLPVTAGGAGAADTVVALWQRYEATMAQWHRIGAHKIVASPRQGEADAVMARANEIADEIERTSAATIEGIIAKARLAKEFYGGDNSLADTLLDDLLRLRLT